MIPRGSRAFIFDFWWFVRLSSPFSRANLPFPFLYFGCSAQFVTNTRTRRLWCQKNTRNEQSVGRETENRDGEGEDSDTGGHDEASRPLSEEGPEEDPGFGFPAPHPVPSLWRGRCSSAGGMEAAGRAVTPVINWL